MISSRSSGRLIAAVAFFSLAAVAFLVRPFFGDAGEARAELFAFASKLTGETRRPAVRALIEGYPHLRITVDDGHMTVRTPPRLSESQMLVAFLAFRDDGRVLVALFGNQDSLGSWPGNEVPKDRCFGAEAECKAAAKELSGKPDVTW